MRSQDEVLVETAMKKHIGFLGLFFLFFISVEAHQPNSQSRQMFAYFPLNEGGGSTTINNVTGRPHGTLEGGPTWIDGVHSNALSQDGVDSGIDLTDQDEYSPGFNDVTMFIAIRTTAPGASVSNPVITKGAGDQFEFRFAAPGDISGVVAGRLSIVYYNLEGSINPIDLKGSTTINDGQWHLIGFSHQKSANGALVTFWVDGKFDVQGAQNATLMGNGTSELKSGSGAWSGAVHGSIEDFMVYNRILSRAEVKYIYLLWKARGFSGN